MKYQVIFSSMAKIDLFHIIEYYISLNKSTAKKYNQEIIKSIRLLKQFPESGRMVPGFEDIYYDKYRELIYEHYRIIYRIEEEQIIIIRIIDGRRLLEIEMVTH